jgi:glycosyltransferase involved in cell wall biosynthesis
MAFRAELRAELGISHSQMVVIYTGNFADYQGLEELVGAIELVRAVHPQVVFVLVGGSLDEAGRVRRRLLAIPAEGYRLIPRQPWSRMAMYLSAADIAVSPRRYGSNLPLKVIEYLAAGLPIVATNIPAHTTLLDDRLALLVEPSSSGIASGTIQLIEDPLSRIQYEAAAIAYASRHLGAEAFLLSLAHLYESLEGVRPPEQPAAEVIPGGGPLLRLTRKGPEGDGFGRLRSLTLDQRLSPHTEPDRRRLRPPPHRIELRS